MLVCKQQWDVPWRQPVDRHRKGKAEETEEEQVLEAYRLLWIKKRPVNRRQDWQGEGTGAVQGCQIEQCTGGSSQGLKPKSPLSYIYVQLKRQNQTVKYEIDDAWSFRVQLGRLQMPDYWLWCCITALPHRDSVEDKKRIELRAAPYFYRSFSLSQWLFSFFHKGIAKQRDVHRRFEVIESYLAKTEKRKA